jgi:hypothetical protein
MQISQLTLDQFRTSAQIGALVSVTIRAVGARFRIEAETRTGDIVLTTQRGQSPREFVDPTRAFSLLGELGIREYRVDANEWRPEDTTTRRTRPDRAAALRASHATWLAEKLEQSMSDKRANVSTKNVLTRADALIVSAERKQRRAP